MTIPIPDFWLVRRAQGGDEKAFGALYDRHAPRVYNLLRRLCGGSDIATAEDLMQETFLAAHRSLPSWRGAGAFSSWLCGIAVRCYRSRHRGERGLPDPQTLDENAPAPADSDPLARFDQAEARRALDAAIAALPALCREAFVLVYVEEMAYKEAAALLDVPVGTLQSRLNRSKTLLRARLAEQFDPCEPVTNAGTPKGTNFHAL